MPNPVSARSTVPKAVWIVCYLVSPAFPFILLRVSRAISMLECVFGVLCSLLVHLGLIGVLARTDGQPLQVFVNLLMGVCLYLLVLWQYLAGHRAGLWSGQAEKNWRKAGKFFGAFLAVGLFLALLVFHLPFVWH